MFTRQVIMQLKANPASEFMRIVGRDVLPMLCKQRGFRDEITFIATDDSEATANSFWDTKEGTGAFNGAGSPQVMEALSKMTEGTPRVGTAVVSNSTFHKIAAQAAQSR
jgi:hypothetical protein